MSSARSTPPAGPTAAASADQRLEVLLRLIRIGAQSTEVAELVARFIDQLTEDLGSDVGLVYRLVGDRLVLAGFRDILVLGKPVPEQFRSLPLTSDTLVARIARERRLVRAHPGDWLERTRREHPEVLDYQGLGAPLVVGERVVGALVLLRRAQLPFCEADEELLETCASYVALAVEHASLFEEEVHVGRRLRLLLEMGQLVMGSLELAQVLEQATSSLVRLVDATHSYIWLLEPGGQLRGAAASDPKHRELFLKTRLRLDQPSLATLAVRERRPQTERSVEGSPHVNPNLNVHFRVKSLIALPLLVRGEPVGAVTIGDQRTEREWTAAELERASLMAGQVAAALANARLFEDLKQSYLALAHTQQQLVQKERLAALGELAAVVAHEVRNPLGVIFNSMAGLRRLLKPTGEAEELFTMAREEAERLNTMVGDLLDFSRPRTPELRSQALAPVVDSAVQATAWSRALNHVQVRVELEDVPDKLPVDGAMLRQALVNLLLNAAQALPKGGVITVRAEVERRGDRSLLQLDVSDDGPGIPPERAERIFQPFFTTRATGSGLGLAVVKGIAEAHGGEVTLEPSTRGATFRLRLPLNLP